jgi:RpiB/LacA/LacB family sugar-phosphate isomerase
MKVAIGADHAGFELKQKIGALLNRKGITVADKGTNAADSVDYPDFARAVAEDVARKRADLGILVCGTGIGMSICANKTPGIRAAKVCTEYEAEMSRAHNDANVLCLGARTIDTQVAKQIVEKFLATPFAGGRHQQRVDKIAECERVEVSQVER